MRLDDLQWNIPGGFWYRTDGKTEITPHQLLEYTIHLKVECNRLYGVGQKCEGEVEQLDADLAASVRQCVQFEADNERLRKALQQIGEKGAGNT